MTVVNGDGNGNVLKGSDFADIINGFGGNDVLHGLGGGDFLDGSSGFDFVDYSASTAAVFIDRANNTATGGDAEGDVLLSIENFVGSSFDDGILGDSGGNAIIGGAGDDFLLGNGGNDVLIGGAGADNMSGGEGIDIASYEDATVGVIINLLNGTIGGGNANGDILSGFESLRGSSFGDTLTGDNTENGFQGGNGDDILSGLGGKDTIDGGAGIDTLSGGDQDDVLIGGAGADILNGDAGFDAADYSTSGSSVFIDLANSVGEGGDAQGDTYTSIEKIIGSAFDDGFLGTDASEQFFGGAGTDTIFGGGAADHLDGGADSDILFGGEGADILVGGASGDAIDGGAGVDTATYIDSEVGVNIVLAFAIAQGGDAAGDSFVDVENLDGSNFADTITGDLGDNRLRGLNGGDELGGLGGNDRLEGGLGDDALSGDGDNDVLIGGAGADRLDGGEGIDIADYSASSAAIILSLSSDSTTTLRANAAGAVGASGGDAEGDVLDDIEQVIGSAFSDDIEGDVVANKLLGGDGGDLLKGGGGGDTLDGGAGSDILVGGSGNDLYIVTRTDNISEVVGEGTADRAAATESFTLGDSDNIEILSTTDTKGFSDINLTGNKLTQEILGNAGDNLLHTGGGGADVMKGLGGNDIYRVFNSGDVVVETAGNGNDAVIATVDYKLGTGVHVETLQTNGSTGTSAIDLTGNEFGQQITGNAGANRLEGKGGIDTLRGGSGADTFVFASTLGAAHVDKILDFSVPADRMLLSDAIFTALDTGTLSAAAFRANNTGLAQDASDHIIYDRHSGKLFYDADGLGGSAGIHFATLTIGLALTNADFSVA
ncbi:calcium-binding protein [Mesorhizobium sp. CN2-181]|uniref:calcium-binding protein n=1 Tax=Mesorhizobium yinganensis TaxID=3157707 RepID=UPI0032B84D70